MNSFVSHNLADYQIQLNYHKGMLLPVSWDLRKTESRGNFIDPNLTFYQNLLQVQEHVV